MCGIIFHYSANKRDNVVPKVLIDYIEQHSRGTDGFGIVYLAQDGTIICEHETDERTMMERLTKISSHMMLFHHRIPTSTSNVLSACHPFVHGSPGREFYTVHNGILYNEHQLKAAHVKEGYVYRSLQENTLQFNDSEALAVDLSKVLSGATQGLESRGSIAFITLEVDSLTKRLVTVHFGHNSGSPLAMIQSGKNLSLASELVGGTYLETHKLFSWNPVTGLISEKDMLIPVGGYSHSLTTAPSSIYGDYGLGNTGLLESGSENDYADWKDEENVWRMTESGNWYRVSDVGAGTTFSDHDSDDGSDLAERRALSAVHRKILNEIEEEISNTDISSQYIASFSNAAIEKLAKNATEKFLEYEQDTYLHYPLILQDTLEVALSELDAFVTECDEELRRRKNLAHSGIDTTINLSTNPS